MRFIFCLHDEHKGRLFGVQLREEPIKVPLEGAEHRGLENRGLEDFFDFDVIAGALVAEGPGLFDDTLWVVQS